MTANDTGNGIVAPLGQGYLLVRSRFRVTRDGGHSILAVSDPDSTTRIRPVSGREDAGVASVAEASDGVSPPEASAKMSHAGVKFAMTSKPAPITTVAAPRVELPPTRPPVAATSNNPNVSNTPTKAPVDSNAGKVVSSTPLAQRLQAEAAKAVVNAAVIKSPTPPIKTAANATGSLPKTVVTSPKSVVATTSSSATSKSKTVVSNVRLPSFTTLIKSSLCTTNPFKAHVQLDRCRHGAKGRLAAICTYSAIFADSREVGLL